MAHSHRRNTQHGCERVRAGKCVRYTRDALHRWMQQRAEQ
jgi:hypothetical protein